MIAAEIRSTGCPYCGLPVPRAKGGEALYCCFGCRFAAQVTQARGEHGQVNWTLTRLGLAIFFTMNVMVFTMALWTQDLYGPDHHESAWIVGLQGLFRYLCLFFALPVLLLLGGPLFESAWDQTQRGRSSADLLMLLGVMASYLYSALALLRDDSRVYFEVGCVVLVFVTLGRWLEATGRLKATQAIASLHQLLPTTVRLIRDGSETAVSLEGIAAGDCLHVLPGERIPCDGKVRQQPAMVDEQLLTGESTPVAKEPGEPVFAGTLNLDGNLTLEVTATAAAGTLARLIELVQSALRSKGRYERLADATAAWFLPAVISVALAASAWHGWHNGIDQGILTGLAVLLIACPCALGLATPMAVWAALGRAARAQVLFRTGEALERLATVRSVCLDKTGTLTAGAPTVSEFAVADDADRDEVLSQSARLASASLHGYAEAISHFARQAIRCPEATEPLEVRTLPGRGLTGWRQDRSRQLFLGSPRLMEESQLACRGAVATVVSRSLQNGQALSCVGWDQRVQGAFVFQERLRPEATEAIALLRRQGLSVTVLTGDHAGRGAALAQLLGISVRAGLLPEGKVAAIAEVRRVFGPVAMLGDGINDAPALAHSDVGVALGCGADVSRESAAVCLLGNDLRRLPWAIDLARQTVRVIRQNLFWAFAYNTIGVGLACGGYLSPVWASLAMVLSGAFVVGNSLRLGSGDAV